MWPQEAEAGRQLVQVRVLPGVVDIPPLLRDEYQTDALIEDMEDEDDEVEDED